LSLLKKQTSTTSRTNRNDVFITTKGYFSCRTPVFSYKCMHVC